MKRKLKVVWKTIYALFTGKIKVVKTRSEVGNIPKKGRKNRGLKSLRK